MSNKLVKRDSGTVRDVKNIGTGAVIGIGGTVLVMTVGLLPGVVIAGVGVVAWKIFKRR